MPGVKIGDGAIIAAYSVVVKDVPPYSLAGGNPARFVKKRFDDELIDILLELRWWDLDKEQLADLLPALCSPDLAAVKDQFRALCAERRKKGVFIKIKRRFLTSSVFFIRIG